MVQVARRNAVPVANRLQDKKSRLYLLPAGSKAIPPSHVEIASGTWSCSKKSYHFVFDDATNSGYSSELLKLQ